MPKRVPLQITGPAYTHPSKPTNAQRCVNMYPSFSSTNQEPENTNKPIEQGRGVATLLRTAGTKFIGQITPVVGTFNPHCRGMVQIQVDVNTYRTFVVIANYLYELSTHLEDEQITPIAIGQLKTSHGNIRFAYNPYQLIILDYDAELNVGSGFIYDYADDIFTEIYDPAFKIATHVVMIDGYFILNEAGSARFYTSDINDGLTYNPLNIATAESSPGQIVGLAQAKGELWIFCTSHTEVWFDEGNSPGMPFGKRVGSDIDIGCVAPMSITQVNDAIIWMDDRGFVVMSVYSQFFRDQSSGYDLTKLSNEALDAEIASYSVISDAIGSTYVDNGHIMFELTFPTESKTWVYDLTTNCWHEKSSEYFANKRASMTNYYLSNNQFLLAGSISDTNMYLVSRNYLDDNGVPIKRIRTTQHYTSNFSMQTLDQLEIKCDVGRSPLGISPNIVLQYSNDSGYTWSHQLPRSLGKTGQYGKRITWNRLGTAQEWTLKFTISDPVDFSIIDAAVIGSAEVL